MQTSAAQTRSCKRIKRCNFFQKVSPFVLLAPALVVACPFIFAGTEINTKDEIIKVIALPFIIANTVYADFALRKFFKTQKRALIWVIESIISGFIIYWIV